MWAESLYELKFKHCVWLPRKFKKILDLKPINQRLAKPNDMKPPNPNLHRSARPSRPTEKVKFKESERERVWGRRDYVILCLIANFFKRKIKKFTTKLILFVKVFFCFLE